MKELKSLGLTENEIKVYIAVLKQEASTIKSLTSISGVKRTTIYSCLNKLKKLGLIIEGRKNKKRVFIADEPEKLLEGINQEEKNLQDKIKQRKKIINSLLPQLKAIAKKTTEAPKVRFYEGLAGCWSIGEDFLKEKKDLFELGSSIKAFENVDVQESIRRITNRRRQIGKTKSYMITDKYPEIVKRYFLKELDFREYRFLPKEIKLDSYVIIYGDKVALLSTKKPLWGMIIESKEIAKTMKFLWDIAWKSLEGKNLPEKKLKLPEYA